MKTLNPEYLKAIKEVLASPTTPRDLCRQFDQFVNLKGVNVVTRTRFEQNRYEIVIDQLVPYDTLQKLMAEMEVLFRPHSPVELFVVGSSLGLKLVAKLRTADPLIKPEPSPITFAVEAGLSDFVGSLSKLKTNFSARGILNGIVDYLDARDEKKMKTELVRLVDEIEDLIDEQVERIDHESKIMHDDLSKVLKRLKDFEERARSLKNHEPILEKLDELRSHFQERFRVPLIKCAQWTKKLTDQL